MGKKGGITGKETIAAYGGQTKGTSWPRKAKLVEKPFKVPSGGATIVKVGMYRKGICDSQSWPGFSL